MISFLEFKENAQRIEEQVRAICLQYHRDPQSVKILPVTKGHPVDAVAYAKEYGFGAIGENWIQEAVAKKQEFVGNLKWECIGHVQSNKAKLAVQYFDRIQSIDSVKLAQKINTIAQEQGKKQRILLEVNTGEDPNKFGVLAQDADKLLESVLACDFLSVEGLMTVAPLTGGKSAAEKAFFKLAELRERLQQDFKIKLPELSMGMSDDFDVAIKAGSTLIRVGTALFGNRIYKN